MFDWPATVGVLPFNPRPRCAGQNTWQAADTVIRTGKRAAQMLMKARILLAADVDGPVLSDSRIVEMLGTNRSSVERMRLVCPLRSGPP